MAHVSRTGASLSAVREIEEEISGMERRESAAERALREAGITADPSQLKSQLHDYTEMKNKLLVSGRTVRTAHLALTLEVRPKAHRAMGHDRYLVVLKIANKSGKHLAYRVLTEPFDSRVECRTGGPLRHHTFLLAPGGSVSRREGCSPVHSVMVKVSLVQVETLSEPNFLLLARLNGPVGLPARLRAGHEGVRTPLSPCVIPMRYSLEQAIRRNPDKWFGFIRFYATHDCGTEGMQ